jgi:hypothetical protein
MRDITFFITGIDSDIYYCHATPLTARVVTTRECTIICRSQISP